MEIESIRYLINEALRNAERGRKSADEYEQTHKGEFGTYAHVCGIYSANNDRVLDLLKQASKAIDEQLK